MMVAQPQESKLAPGLRELDPASSVDVIIQFHQTPSEFTHSRVVYQGGRHHRTFESIHAAHYTVPVSSLSELENDPDVVFVHPDRAVKATGTATPDYGWVGVDGLSSPYLSVGWDGSGIGVAVIDSGINGSGDLNTALILSRIVYSQSFVAGDSSTADAYGHGTHVAGLVGGNGNSSSSILSSYVAGAGQERRQHGQRRYRSDPTGDCAEEQPQHFASSTYRWDVQWRARTKRIRCARLWRPRGRLES